LQNIIRKKQLTLGDNMKKLIDKIWSLYKKYEEIISYLIFGVLTTIVSIASYAIFAHVFNIQYMISTVLAWIVSVSFAYITNKIFVFKSKNLGLKGTIIECFKFYAARIFTLLVDLAFKKFFVDFMHMNDMIATTINQFIIIVLNYVLSKILVFRNKNKSN